jgi:hypothetical protein
MLQVSSRTIICPSKSPTWDTRQTYMDKKGFKEKDEVKGEVCGAGGGGYLRRVEGIWDGGY